MKHKPKQYEDVDNVYKTTGYDDKGNSKNLIHRNEKLKPNHYLKIKEKLNTVRSYDEVKKMKFLKSNE